VLPALLTVAGLVAIFTWQQDRRAADVEELDAQLLTDDLPLDAYLDKGFEAWLKKVSSDNSADDR
jgi:predicted signal transduction protein with EAL and GGDEF domain